MLAGYGYAGRIWICWQDMDMLAGYGYAGRIWICWQDKDVILGYPISGHDVEWIDLLTSP